MYIIVEINSQESCLQTRNTSHVHVTEKKTYKKQLKHEFIEYRIIEI